MPQLADLQKLTLRFLGIRPRTISEVKTYLAKKNATPSQIDQLLDYLQTHHLVNDHDFVDWYVTSRLRHRPVSRQVLNHELARYGIDLAAYPISVDEVAGADTALAKAAYKWTSLAGPVQRQKQIDFLHRRGFSWSIIEQVLKKRYNDNSC